jgi:hypothetical protein
MLTGPLTLYSLRLQCCILSLSPPSPRACVQVNYSPLRDQGLPRFFRAGEYNMHVGMWACGDVGGDGVVAEPEGRWVTVGHGGFDAVPLLCARPCPFPVFNNQRTTEELLPGILEELDAVGTAVVSSQART